MNGKDRKEVNWVEYPDKEPVAQERQVRENDFADKSLEREAEYPKG